VGGCFVLGSAVQDWSDVWQLTDDEAAFQSPSRPPFTPSTCWFSLRFGFWRIHYKPRGKFELGITGLLAEIGTYVMHPVLLAVLVVLSTGQKLSDDISNVLGVTFVFFSPIPEMLFAVHPLISSVNLTEFRIPNLRLSEKSRSLPVLALMVNGSISIWPFVNSRIKKSFQVIIDFLIYTIQFATGKDQTFLIISAFVRR